MVISDIGRVWGLWAVLTAPVARCMEAAAAIWVDCCGRMPSLLSGRTAGLKVAYAISGVAAHDTPLLESRLCDFGWDSDIERCDDASPCQFVVRFDGGERLAAEAEELFAAELDGREWRLYCDSTFVNRRWSTIHMRPGQE